MTPKLLLCAVLLVAMAGCATKTASEIAWEKTACSKSPSCNSGATYMISTIAADGKETNVQELPMHQAGHAQMTTTTTAAQNVTTLDCSLPEHQKWCGDGLHTATELVGLEQRISALEKQNAALEARVKELDHKNYDLQSKVSFLENRMDGAGGFSKVQVGFNGVVTEEIVDLKARLKKLEQKEHVRSAAPWIQEGEIVRRACPDGQHWHSKGVTVEAGKPSVEHGTCHDNKTDKSVPSYH